MYLRALALALVFSVTPAMVHVSEAHAQGAEKPDPFTDMARQRFQEGVKLFDAKRFEEARAAFLQAYALKKHPAVLLNLAQSELKSGHPVDAARHFAQYLQDNAGAAPADRKTAEQGISEARLKTGRVQVDVNVPGAEIFVDDELVGKAPLREAVDVGAGAHKIEARFSGYPNATGQVTAAVGQVVALSLKLDKGGSTAAVVAPVPTTAPTGTENPPPAPTETSAPPPETPPDADKGAPSVGRKPFFTWMKSDPVAWGTGGAAVLGVGLGIVFSVLAYNSSANADSQASQIRVRADGDVELNASQKEHPCTTPPLKTATTDYGPACQKVRDNLDSLDWQRPTAIVSWVVGAVGAFTLVGMYFVRTNPKKTTTASARNTTVVPIMSPTYQGLAVGGTF
jgi:hypothetical protein